MIFQIRRHRGIRLSRQRAPKPKSKRIWAGKLLRTALPISLGAVAMSFSGLIDASFLQTRVAYAVQTDPAALLSMYAGAIPKGNLAAPETVPNYLFGCYNMALTLFLLVPSVTQSFGVSALPSVTRAFQTGDSQKLKRTVEAVLRITFLTALPMGVGLSVLAQPAALLIYGARPGTVIVGRVLTTLGAASVFAALCGPLNSILQAMGHVELPVVLTLTGLFVKAVLDYTLAAVPRVNVLGGAVGTLVCYALASVLACIQTHEEHDGGVAELGVGAAGIDNAGGGQCCGDGRAEDDQRDLLRDQQDHGDHKDNAGNDRLCCHNSDTSK